METLLKQVYQEFSSHQCCKKYNTQFVSQGIGAEHMANSQIK
jgi:hypothetical protein